MIFYIDFDYTLFDTYAFRTELYQILKENGIEKSYLALTSEQEEYELLNIRNLFEQLSRDENIPLDKFMKPLEILYKKSTKFVYNDVVEFLKWLRAEKQKTYILTWGDEQYQSEKVKASKLERYVDGVIYSEKLKYTLDLDYKNATFIDDSIRDLKGLYDKEAKFVFRIKRKYGKNSDKELKMKDILEFDSLDELKNYLCQNKLTKKYNMMWRKV